MSVQVESSFPRKSLTFFAVNMLGACIQLGEKKSVLADLRALLLKMTGSVSGKLMFIHIYSVLRYFRAQADEVLITLAYVCILHFCFSLSICGPQAR